MLFCVVWTRAPTGCGVVVVVGGRGGQDAPVTVQTAAEAWDRRRRAPEATMGRLLYDETTQLEARQGASELAYSAMRTVG